MQANKQDVKRLLNTAKGQIDGLIKMVDSNEYCINISNQILAAIAILKKVNVDVLSAHLNHCVLNCTDLKERTKKMEEITSIMKKITR